MNSLEGYCRRELIKFKFIELYLKRNRRKAIENEISVKVFLDVETVNIEDEYAIDEDVL